MAALTSPRILRSKSNLVSVCPATPAPAIGTANWGPDAGNTYREYLTRDHRCRIRKTGSIRAIRVAGPATLTGQSLLVRVWRRTEPNLYRLVGQSDDLIGSITAGAVSTVTLPAPIEAEEGDYLGYRLDGIGTTAWHSQTLAGATTYRVNASTPAQVNFPWESQTAIADEILVTEALMAAPTAVLIGDSLISGYSTNYSFLEATEFTNLSNAISAHLRSLFPTTVNHGSGGSNLASIAARFSADVVAMKPRYTIIEGGVNNLSSVTTAAEMLASFQAMIELCQANGIVPILLKILPYTGGSTLGMQKRDAVNAGLDALAAVNPGTLVVDASSRIGEERAGGDPGNLWNIQAIYNQGDNVHLTPAGYRQVALAIEEAVT